MTRVGFITSPLSTGHVARGVGFYTSRLLRELKRQSAKFKIELVENGFDCQLVHYPWFDLFFHTLPIFRSYKTVVTIHDVIPLEYPDHYPPGLKGAINLQLQKLALSTADLVLTDSMASIKSITKYLGVPHAKLRLIYLAADEKFKPITNKQVLTMVANKYHLPSEFVLYVGDVNWNKNIPNLVLACRQAGLPLVMVGKQAREIEQMDLNHAELVHLRTVNWEGVMRLGFVPDTDLVAIYNLATVYCQPSFAEGFGLPVLEALACDTPVAVSQASSLPEIAQVATVYFDPTDVANMAMALRAPQPNGRVTQAKKFSWQRAALETLKIYASLI